MKLSDRDLKLIVLVLIVLMIALPILFVIRPYREKTKLLTADITTLSERQAYLSALNENRQFYLDSMELLKKERNKIVQGFAEGIRRENTIMFLANTEKSIPIAMSTISFADSEVTQITDSYTDAEGNYIEGLGAVSTSSAIVFTGEYENVKSLLDFIQKNQNRMVITNFVALQSPVTGLVEGSVTLKQYAVFGEGRELAPAKIPEFQRGNENIFGPPMIDGEIPEEEEEEGGEGAEE